MVVPQKIKNFVRKIAEMCGCLFIDYGKTCGFRIYGEFVCIDLFGEMYPKSCKQTQVLISMFTCISETLSEELPEIQLGIGKTSLIISFNGQNFPLINARQARTSRFDIE